MPALRSRREQWLLALLVLRHDRDTDREWLATTLWPDNDEQQALFYLRKALSNLRKALGSQAPRLISPSARTVRLELANAFVDVVEFEKGALEQYRGPLLPDCQEDWAIAERNQLEQAYIAALEQRMADDPVRYGRLLIAADPYRESAYRALMQALADAGDRAAVTVVYRELQDRLAKDLNGNPSPETEALYKELRHRERQTLPSAPAQETKRHLPVPLTDLIGREQEIKEVLSWMKQRRMVTLVGTGGVGKTRLSIAVAEAALPRFEDGAWFVDLAPLTDPALIPQATAKALGVAEEQSRPIKETLTQTLSTRSILLVLDNCEQFTEACADFAQQLLSSCPALTIIATSRQPLHIVGEQVLRVPSLPVDSEAVQLFADRAVRANSEFRLTEKNTADIVEICRHLDGIPLAIEMAAARVRSLSIGEIKMRLGDRFRLLKSGNKGALPRQHTLRATIDWSHDQLSEPERTLLRRVSVFAGGWTLEAAEAVAALQDVDELLSSLADKSLVIAETGETTRYRLLETVRQHALYHLTETGELLSTRMRHRDYFLGFAFDIKPKLMAADQAHWFAVLDSEHDNLRQALSFCIEHEPATGVKLAGGLSRYWLTRGYYSEGRTTFSTLLALAPERTEHRAIALNGAGLLAWRQSDYKAAEAAYEESLSIARELDDRLNIARALNNLALITRDQGGYDVARGMHEESIQIFRDCGEKLIAAVCLSNLGVVHQYQGDFTAARAAYEEGLAVQRELGERSSTGVTLNSLGEVALDQGDYEFARKCHEEGLAIATELEDNYGRASHLYGLGCAASQRGDTDQAMTYLLESLPLMAGLGERTLVTDHFSAIASLADPERAVRLHAARDTLRGATGSPLPPYALRKMEAEVAALRDRLGVEGFERAWKEGSEMSLEQAIAYAMETAQAQTSNCPGPPLREGPDSTAGRVEHG